MNTKIFSEKYRGLFVLNLKVMFFKHVHIFLTEKVLKLFECWVIFKKTKKNPKTKTTKLVIISSVK